MKSLNVASLVAALLIAACTFVSCKKDKADPAPVNVIEGNWEGLYGYGNNAPTVYFSFVIHKDGTLQVKAVDKDDPSLATGTWTLKDNEFKAVYQYEGESEKLNVAAKYDAEQKKLTGNWGHGEADPKAGGFIMNKQ